MMLMVPLFSILDLILLLTELSDIGKAAGKKYAFEAGLMRSNLSTDHYNEMLCTEELIQCQGQPIK